MSKRQKLAKWLLGNPVCLLDYPHAKIQMKGDTRLLAARAKACAKEPDTVAWLEEHMEPTDVLYDIGACVGAYSLIANKLGASVYAFEPSFSNFSVLMENIHLNKVRIQAFQIALSDKTGLADFHYRDTQAGKAMHSLHTPVNEENGVLFMPSAIHQVMTYSLDDFIQVFNLPKPTFIKLDIDAGIGPALAGMRQTLNNPVVKSVFIELHSETEHYPFALSLFQSAGFNQINQPGKGWGNYCFSRNFIEAHDPVKPCYCPTCTRKPDTIICQCPHCDCEAEEGMNGSCYECATIGCITV